MPLGTMALYLTKGGVMDDQTLTIYTKDDELGERVLQEVLYFVTKNILLSWFMVYHDSENNVVFCSPVEIKHAHGVSPVATFHLKG